MSDLLSQSMLTAVLKDSAARPVSSWQVWKVSLGLMSYKMRTDDSAARAPLTHHCEHGPCFQEYFWMEKWIRAFGVLFSWFFWARRKTAHCFLLFSQTWKEPKRDSFNFLPQGCLMMCNEQVLGCVGFWVFEMIASSCWPLLSVRSLLCCNPGPVHSLSSLLFMINQLLPLPAFLFTWNSLTLYSF